MWWLICLFPRSVLLIRYKWLVVSPACLPPWWRIDENRSLCTGTLMWSGSSLWQAGVEEGERSAGKGQLTLWELKSLCRRACLCAFPTSCNSLPAASPSPSQGNNGSGATLAEMRDLKIDLWRAKIGGGREGELEGGNISRKHYLIVFSNRFIFCKVKSHRVCCLGLYEQSRRPDSTLA